MNIFKLIYHETIKQLYYRLNSTNDKLECIPHVPDKSSAYTFVNQNVFDKFKYIFLELIKTKDTPMTVEYNDFMLALSYNEYNKCELCIRFRYDDKTNQVENYMSVYDTNIHSTSYTTGNCIYVDDLSLNDWLEFHKEVMQIDKKRILNNFEESMYKIKDTLNISRNEKLNQMKEIFNSFDDEKAE